MEASLMAQTVKNLIAMRETQVRSLGQEDLLEKGITPTPVFLPGEFHGERRLEDCSPQGCRVSHNWVTKYSKYSNYTDLLLVHLMSNLHLLLPYPVRLSRFMWRFAWSTELAKKKWKFSSYPISPTCQCFQLWLVSDPSRAQVRRCSKSNARLRRRLENNCKVLLIISLSKGKGIEINSEHTSCKRIDLRILLYH